MLINKVAIAGTLESSDVQITVEPAESGIELIIESSVINQYGYAIKAIIKDTLKKLGIDKGKVTVIDKGALDCTLKARLECAIYRSCDKSMSNIEWGKL